MEDQLKLPEVPFKLLKIPFIDWSQLYFLKSSYKFIIENTRSFLYWRNMDENIIQLRDQIDKLCHNIHLYDDDDREKYKRTLLPYILFINRLPDLKRIPKNPTNKDYIIHLCVVYNFLYHNFIINRMNQDRLYKLFDEKLTEFFFKKILDSNDIALELWKEYIPGSDDIPLFLISREESLRLGGKPRKKSIKTKKKYRKLTKRKLRH